MDSINAFAGHWAAWMAGISWQLCVLVLALLLIDPLLRRRSATVRYGIWSLVLLRLVLPPTFALPTGWGWWTADWSTPAISQTATPPMHRGAGDARDSQAPNLLTQPPLRRPLFADGRRTETRTLVLEDARAPVGAAAEVEERPASLPDRARQWFFDAAPILLLLYLGIVCAQLGMLFSSSLQVRSWASKARLIVDPEIQQRFADCRDRVGIHGSVELRDSEACTTPLVVGLWRPVIMIPSTILEKLTNDELAAVLTHELQHIRRRDALVNLAQALLGVVYFFHPLLWLANARIRALREDVCDEFTLNSLKGGARPYGSALIKVAETLGYAAPPLAMGVLDGKTPLKQRMVRILDPRTASHNPWGVQSFVITTLLALILLPGGRPASGNPWNVVRLFSSAPAATGPSEARPTMETAGDESSPPLPIPGRPAPKEVAPLPATGLPTTLAGKSSDLRPLKYFQGDEKEFHYIADVAVDNGDRSQRFTGTIAYEVLSMNEKSVVTMFRPRLRQERVSVDRAALAPGEPFLSDRWLMQDHPQAWSRWGVAQPNDGPPLPFLHRSFASLLLPWLPAEDELQTKENRSWSIEVPSWLGTTTATSGHPLDRFPVHPGSGLGRSPFGDLLLPPWERGTPKLHMVEKRVSQKLGADADGLLTIQESIEQQSQGTGPQVKLQATMTALLDPVRKLPVETQIRVVLSREDVAGQWIKLPIHMTFLHVETKTSASPN